MTGSSGPAGAPWLSGAPGVLTLPSGRAVRGRGLRVAAVQGPDASGPADAPPDLTVFLLGRTPPAVPHESRWLRWPDFGLPLDRRAVEAVLTEAWRRAAAERVEVVCGGGRGRTGTALACLAVLDGVPAERAVDLVRSRYHPRAVETPWQRWYVRRFDARLSDTR